MPTEIFHQSLHFTPIESAKASVKLAALVAEHDDLDSAIAVLLERGSRDDLMITRLKKRKLQIKDEIVSAAPPDHIAARATA